MKTNEILPEKVLIKKEQINEGFRFGERERREVGKRRDVLVGIEYEYHIDENHYGVESSNMEDLARDVERALESERDEFVADFRENDMDEFHIEDITSDISSLEKIAEMESYKEIFNNLELEDDSDEPQQQLDFGEPGVTTKAQTYIKYVVELNKVKYLGTIEALTDSDWSEGLERINIRGTSRHGENWGHLDLSELAELEDFAREYNGMGSQDIINELTEKVIENDGIVAGTELEDFVNKLNEIVDNIVVDWPGDRTMDEKMREEFEESATDLWDSEYRDDRYEQIEQYFLNSGEYSEGGSEALADEVRNDLEYRGHEYGLDWNSIEEVTTDESVPDGVEVITHPEPIEDAMETMEAMFSHIREVGSTSTITGLHVNMSIKGLTFNKQNFNKVKFIVLMDLAHLITPDSKGFIKFPPRNHVSDMLESVSSPLDMFTMASSTNFDHVVNTLEKLIEEDTKYQSINFSHAFGEYVSPHLRRVEMRFFGGKDYEKRYDEIYWNIHRAAYMMLAGFDKEFGDREYKQLIYRWLNRISERQWNVSFAELSKVVKGFVGTDINFNSPSGQQDALEITNILKGRK